MSDAPPDALFDADLSLPLGKPNWIDRFDWVVMDGEVLHAPATWTWHCPACGESGAVTHALDLGAFPHRAQHAEGVFGEITPLDIGVVRPDVC